MRRIDPTHGPRAGLYAHFRRFERPHFTLCARVDVGPLLTGGSPFPVVLRQVMCAVNAVPELRQRIRQEDGRDVIVEHPVVDATCTVSQAGAFTFCHMKHLRDRAEFLRQVPVWAARAAQTTGLDLEQQPRDDMIYLSCLPWLDFSTVQHAETGDRDDCVPRIIWGKVVGGSVQVCLTAHHALVDGQHAARFFQLLGDPSLDCLPTTPQTR